MGNRSLLRLGEADFSLVSKDKLAVVWETGKVGGTKEDIYFSFSASETPGSPHPPTWTKLQAGSLYYAHSSSATT